MVDLGQQFGLAASIGTFEGSKFVAHDHRMIFVVIENKPLCVSRIRKFFAMKPLGALDLDPESSPSVGLGRLFDSRLLPHDLDLRSPSRSPTPPNVPSPNASPLMPRPFKAMFKSLVDSEGCHQNISSEHQLNVPSGPASSSCSSIDTFPASSRSSTPSICFADMPDGDYLEENQHTADQSFMNPAPLTVSSTIMGLQITLSDDEGGEAKAEESEADGDENFVVSGWA